MADHETGLREDITLRDPALDVDVERRWEQVGGIDDPADGHQHACRQPGYRIKCGAKDRASLAQVSEHAPEGDVDQRPAIARPPVRQRSDGSRPIAEAAGVGPLRRVERGGEGGEVRCRTDGAGNTWTVTLECVRDLVEYVLLDPRLGDADLHLRDTQAVGRDGRRVLARLAHNEARSPALAQPHGRAEHRVRGMTGEQLAIDQTRDLLGRPRSHPLPQLVDHRPGWLGADPERNPCVRGGVGQGRRDEHDRLVSETIKGSCGRDQRREMAKSAERAAEQHAHVENIGDSRPGGLPRSVDRGRAMLSESDRAPKKEGEAWMAERRLMSAEGVEELRAELHRLETVERAKVVEQIKTAREWGDLKENAEYHAAKDAQGRLETRILRLRQTLLDAEVVEVGAGTDGTARFGATVTFEDESGGQAQSVRLVASHDANPSAGTLSVESPIGAALNGRGVGQVVEVKTPKGVRRLRITAVS